MGDIRLSIMHCKRFEGLLAIGASRAFLVRCDDGHFWVVKSHGNPLGTKAVFNEYIAGVLAKAINLLWSRISIAELAPNVTLMLRQEQLEVLTKGAVNLGYVSELKKVGWPRNGDPWADEFSKRNAQHIRQLFPDPKTYSAFYGKAVFDNWLILEDTKYDTFHINSDGYSIFPDTTIALCG